MADRQKENFNGIFIIRQQYKTQASVLIEKLVTKCYTLQQKEG